MKLRNQIKYNINVNKEILDQNHSPSYLKKVFLGEAKGK
jgi:hypothetical protein